MTNALHEPDSIEQQLVLAPINAEFSLDVAALQIKVREQLGPDKAHRSAPKTLPELEYNLSDPNIAVGAFVDGKLVGCVCAVTPLDPVFVDGLKSRKMKPIFTENKSETVAVITLLVDAEFRKHNIASRMLGYLRKEAAAVGFKYMVARITGDNRPGLKTFKKACWEIVGRGQGTDGRGRFFVELNLQSSPVPTHKRLPFLFPLPPKPTAATSPTRLEKLALAG